MDICSFCDKEAKWIVNPTNTYYCDEHAEEYRKKHDGPIPMGGSLPDILWPLKWHRLMQAAGFRE